jgi:hypothetical protein
MVVRTGEPQLLSAHRERERERFSMFVYLKGK